MWRIATNSLLHRTSHVKRQFGDVWRLGTRTLTSKYQYNKNIINIMFMDHSTRHGRPSAYSTVSNPSWVKKALRDIRHGIPGHCEVNRAELQLNGSDSKRPTSYTYPRKNLHADMAWNGISAKEHQHQVGSCILITETENQNGLPRY